MSILKKRSCHASTLELRVYSNIQHGYMCIRLKRCRRSYANIPAHLTVLLRYENSPSLEPVAIFIEIVGRTWEANCSVTM